jgi:hypothetical protein
MPHSEHSRRQQSLSWSRNSPSEYIALPNILLLLRRGIVTPQSNHQAGGPSFVGCPRLLIHHIRRYPPLCGGISLDPQPQGASYHRGDTVAMRNIAVQLTAYIWSQVDYPSGEKWEVCVSRVICCHAPCVPATCRLHAHSCRTPADHTTQSRGVLRSVALADWQARRVPLQQHTSPGIPRRYGTRKFITVFARARHRSVLSHMNPIYTATTCFLEINFTPTVIVEWLTLIGIRKVPGSNLGPETGYPDWGFFVVFLSPSRQIPG